MSEEVRQAERIREGDLIDALPLARRFGLAADMPEAEYEYALVEEVERSQDGVGIHTNMGSWAIPNDYPIIVLTEKGD